ncbi:MAG: NUDIX domain-containing protein [Bacteroidia bacterium]|nr:NUDIX domain-containing protein [Bacteroidia bacterium]
MYQKNDFCSWCGTKFLETKDFPRACLHCNNITYLNPTPVAVLIQPILEGGVLLIERGIPPHIGKYALPGGFIDIGETWQQAAARELKEETGVEVPASDIQLFDVVSAHHVLLVFGWNKPISHSLLNTFKPTNETTAYKITTQSEELAFPLHTIVLRKFLEIYKSQKR